LLFSYDIAIGSTYSFYVLSYNKGIPSIPSMQTSVNLPITSAPLNLLAINNATTPPNVSLSWTPPSNNNIISSDSYNIYQDNVLVHNVVQPSFNTDPLVAGQTYTFVVKPLHGSVEFNSPVSLTLTAYQPSSAPTNLIAQPKNNTIILSWNDPVNTGGLTPSQYNLSYINDAQQTITLTIPFSSSGNYAQTINGLTNKNNYTFTLFLVSGSKNGPQLNGQTASITSSPSGSPIIQSISFTNKTLSASVDGNGSNLLGNFIIVSYDASNVPTVNQYATPSATNGIYNISQLLLPNAVKASIVVANASGITSGNSW